MAICFPITLAPPGAGRTVLHISVKVSAGLLVIDMPWLIVSLVSSSTSKFKQGKLLKSRVAELQALVISAESPAFAGLDLTKQYVTPQHIKSYSYSRPPRRCSAFLLRKRLIMSLVGVSKHLFSNLQSSSRVRRVTSSFCTFSLKSLKGKRAASIS